MSSKLQAMAGGVAVTPVTVVDAARVRWPALWMGLVRRIPATLEIALVVAVVVALWPQFETAAGFGLGRDARYAAGGLVVQGLPEPVLPLLCRDLSGQAQAPIAERLCGSANSWWPQSRAVPKAGSTTDLPVPLRRALASARQAFAAPLAQAQQHLDALRARQQEGADDLRPIADAIGVIEAQIDPYARRYGLRSGDASGPAALDCAARSVAAVVAQDRSATHTRADALLLLGAALDGRSATAALAAEASLPVLAVPADCGSLGESLAGASAVLGQARQSSVDARKNDAMRALFASAGWQWAGAMAIAFLLLRLSRSAVAPAIGVGLSLLAWAGAAWAARVPWPLAAQRDFRPARIDAAWSAAPDVYVIALAAAGAVLLLAGLARPGDRAARAAQALSSRIGFAGMAAATGIGWLLLFDLSAHAHPVNRYLALYHQGHLWLALLVFSVLLFLRQPLARGIGWGLSVGGALAARMAASLGGVGAAMLIAALALAGLAVFGLALANMRQLTSELGRIWLIVGGAWFFFLRAGPLAERLARSGTAALSFWRYAAPLGFIVAVLLGAMLVTRDMGPLLIAGYAAGGFVAATLAAWWHQRSGAVVLPYAAAVALFAGWIGIVTLTLFQLGNVDTVTAARLESLAAPFASNNDQLALVSWFQHAAPADGFGLGAAPWCGHAASGRCSGVPAQVHSDYTFTALVGVFGAPAAWAGWVACALWLHRLIRHHGRVTRGEPRLVADRAGRLADDGQGLLSWVGVAWVVLTLCQLAVTVAGNLAVLPLTGVTFPFVSFGMTSLVVNFAFLALCLNVTLPQGARHG